MKKCAIISDLHGNLSAVEAVLKDIEELDIQHIFCAGDFVDPFRESVEVWNLLKQKKIPTIRGNHEDYVVNYLAGGNLPKDWMTFNRTTLIQISEHIGNRVAKEFKELPFELELEFEDGAKAHLCHASFTCNYKSHIDGFHNELKEFAMKHPADLFISGHKHFHDRMFFHKNQFVIIGSLGMPLNRDTRSQYIIVERRDSDWNIEHRRVEYDRLKTINLFEEDDWLYHAGAMGLLFVDQLLIGEDRLSPFVNWLKSQRSHLPKDAPKDHKEWLTEAIRYLDFHDRLQQIKETLCSRSLKLIGL